VAKRKPLLLDEPLQWQLKTTAHDHCPLCGGHVGYYGARSRGCMSSICGTQVELPMPAKKWFEDRMAGGDPTLYSNDCSHIIGVPKYSRSTAKTALGESPTSVPMPLKDAQRDSLDSVAKIPKKVSPHTHTYIYWKAGSYEPHDELKKEIIRAGTPLWRALLNSMLWEPNDPKTILDKMIADEPAKLLRRKSLAV
jgi:hypothetical protein